MPVTVWIDLFPVSFIDAFSASAHAMVCLELRIATVPGVALSLKIGRIQISGGYKSSNLALKADCWRC